MQIYLKTSRQNFHLGIKSKNITTLKHTTFSLYHLYTFIAPSFFNYQLIDQFLLNLFQNLVQEQMQKSVPRFC